MNLEQIHTRLVTEMAAMPWTLGQVYAYEPMRECTPSPAVHIELTEGDDARMQGGWDALDVSLRFVARVLVSASEVRAEMRVRQYAFATAKCLKKLGNIGGGAGVIRIVRIAPDEFKEPLNGYVMWMVEFEFDMPLGVTEEEVEPVINPMNATVAAHYSQGDTVEQVVFTAEVNDE